MRLKTKTRTRTRMRDYDILSGYPNGTVGISSLMKKCHSYLALHNEQHYIIC